MFTSDENHGIFRCLIYFYPHNIHAQHLGDGVHGVHEHHFTERVLIIWFVSKRNLHIKYVGVGRAPENIIF